MCPLPCPDLPEHLQHLRSKDRLRQDDRPLHVAAATPPLLLADGRLQPGVPAQGGPPVVEVNHERACRR